MYGTFSMQPSDDFSNTVDTARETKAVYVGPDTGASVSITCPTSGVAAVFRMGGHVLPTKTKVAVTAAAHTVVYLY